MNLLKTVIQYGLTCPILGPRILRVADAQVLIESLQSQLGSKSKKLTTLIIIWLISAALATKLSLRQPRSGSVGFRREKTERRRRHR